jgi:chromate transporter
MNVGVLFAILVKATFLSFSGFGSLPVLREELVTNRRVLTDDDLNRAVAVARVTPGPMGSYVVAVGYAAAGWPGAVMGWIALTFPALSVIPLGAALRRRRESVRWQSVIEGIILASAALVLATARSLLPDAVVDLPTIIVAIAALIAVSVTEIPTIWVILIGAAVTLAFAAVR